MEMKDLESFYGYKVIMADQLFVLQKKETDDYGIIPVWRSSIYNIYAPLKFNEIELVVEVTVAHKEGKERDFTKCIVGGLRYRHHVPDFMSYVTICTTVIETLLEQKPQE